MDWWSLVIPYLGHCDNDLVILARASTTTQGARNLAQAKVGENTVQKNQNHAY